MSDRVPVRLESRGLEDGTGGLFVNGELVAIFPSEAESDSAALLAVRRMVVDGVAIQDGQAYKDDKPIDLFDMEIR